MGWQGEPGESVGQKGGIIIIIIIDCLCATHPWRTVKTICKTNEFCLYLLNMI